MCCENTSYRQSEINGECEKCGAETVDGDAYDQCAYSSVVCDVCNSAPCEERC